MTGGRNYGGGLEIRLAELERKQRASGAAVIASLGSFSLTSGAASTTVTDAAVVASSKILTAPTDDGGMSLEGAIRCTAGSGSFTATHASSTVTRSYIYVVINSV